MTTESAASSRRAAPIALIIGLFATLVLLLHARSFLPLVFEDALISLRYARRLVEGLGLTFTEGEVVEGYSNLLWVLLCALLHRFGMDLIDASRLLGTLGGVAAIAGIVYAFRPANWSGALPAFAGAMALALTVPIAIWAIAGLETTFLAGLLVWALVFLRPLLDRESIGWKEGIRAGIPLALACLTRADAPLFTVIACAYLLARGATPAHGLRNALRVGLVPGLVTLGQIAFRLAYYGDWLPNTARAKVAFSAFRVESGATCIASAGLASYTLWIPALLFLVVAFRRTARRAPVVLSGVMFLTWTVYACTIACRPFGYRMLVPCFVFLAFLAADGIEWWLGRSRRPLYVAWLVTVILLLHYGWAQQRDGYTGLARGHVGRLTWTSSVTGKMLRRAFEPIDPLVAVDSAGAIPYFSGLRTLDMLGLNDRHIASLRPPEFGQGLQGHELGDGAYVLSRKPDIIVSGIRGARSLSYIGGRQMMADPEFRRSYKPVRMWSDDPEPLSFVIWCRLEGKAGVSREGGVIRIPGYLLASDPGIEARYNDSGALGSLFSTTIAGSLSGLNIEPGKWRFTARGNSGLTIAVRPGPDQPVVTDNRRVVDVAFDQPSDAVVMVRGKPDSFLIDVLVSRLSD